MTKGTILYIGGFELPDKNAAAHRVINNAKAFRDLGYEVVFLGVHKDKRTGLLVDEFMGFKAYSLPYPNGIKDWLRFITSWSMYAEPLNDVQGVSHVCLYNFPAISMYRALRACRQNGIRVISDCSEWYQPSFSDGYARGVIKWVDVQLRMRWANRAVDSVVAISQFLVGYYLKRSRNVVYIPPLVDLTDRKWPQGCDAHEQVGGKVSFFYAGSPFALGSGAKKDVAKDRLDIIIRAFASIRKKSPSLKFVFNIYGLTEPDFIARHPEYRSELLALSGFVFFHGRKPHNDVMAALSNSDFMVFYRDDCLVTKAGFPTKFVEAVSAAVPVITNVNSNVSDYLESEVNGFLDKGSSVGSYVAVLEQALALDQTEMSIMRSNAAAGRRKFHYEGYVEHLKEALC